MNHTEEVAKQITDAMKKEAPYLFHIHERVKGINSGIIDFSIRVYNGKVVDLIQKEVKRIVFEKKP